MTSAQKKKKKGNIAFQIAAKRCGFVWGDNPDLPNLQEEPFFLDFEGTTLEVDCFYQWAAKKLNIAQPKNLVSEINRIKKMMGDYNLETIKTDFDDSKY